MSRDWLAWFLAAVLAGTLWSAGNLAEDIGRPFGGFLEDNVVLWHDRLQVAGTTPEWWPNVRATDLRFHGLVALNGQP